MRRLRKEKREEPLSESLAAEEKDVVLDKPDKPGKGFFYRARGPVP